MDEKAVAQSLLTNLFSQPQTNVFAILDGASVEQLPQLLWEYEPQNVCLYRGELEPDMASVAPYLVKLEFDHRFTKLVCEKGWGKHWGIFAITPADVDIRALRQHFRKFLMVLSPENKTLYFRYYDPRVLMVYLPTCNAEEMKTLFGPVSNYIVEDEDSSVLLRLSYDGEKVRTEKISFTQPR
ncbi:MAG: DUF4123 domain-containing protein [Sedimentisphaerales bacterium]|nr:DUF4123 domain-containing protein [Sedimentisphaerales bacterium]